jgi:CRP/FNR family transcriptional regulator, cyclic AMP receptor protein
MQWELLVDLPEHEQRRLQQHATRRRFAKGTVIFHEGDPGGALHLIDKGRVAVRLSTPTGDTVFLRVIGAGGWFGDLSMISPAQRNATILALEPTETLVIQRDQADELRRRVPEFEALLVNALVAEVRRLSTALLDALFVPVDKRLFRVLVRLDEVYRSADGTTHIPLTQEEVAQLVGTTRPTLNKHLRAAAAAGYLTMRRGSLDLLDLEAITRHAR